MQAGFDTLQQIEQALGDLSAQEQEMHRRLNVANSERSNLLEERLVAIKSLAQVRAKHALADNVINQADKLSVEVRDALQARQKTIAALEERRDSAEQARRKTVAHHEQVSRKIKVLEDRLDELAVQAHASLAGDVDFTAAQDALKTARDTYAKARMKTQQAEQDRETKGQPYRDDPLFMYLWKRKFGLADYTLTGLIRWLDEKVARFIGYHDARANFLVLNQIPERLKAHAGRLAGDLKEKQQAVDQRLADAIKALAGGDLAKDLRDARERQKLDHEALTQLAAELAETVNQLNLYATGRDKSYTHAVDLAAGFLERKSLDQLTALARSTPEPTDDEVVDQIRDIEHRIADTGRESRKLQTKLEDISQRREDLLRIATDFRRNYYDDPGSVFIPGRDGNELEDILGDLIGGAIAGADYWDRARRQHRWDDRPADPYRRSSGLPPWEGGFDPRGGSPDSEFGHDEDFRTGGGF